MTYRGCYIIAEIPTYAQWEITDKGELGDFIQSLDDAPSIDSETFFVVQDEEHCYLESLASFAEAKAYIDWMQDAEHGRPFTFTIAGESA